jgi:hypothetical protein
MSEKRRIRIPAPTSAGLLLSYKCSAACAHCMYACSPNWKADWISEPDLAAILDQLAPTIKPSPFGRDHLGLSAGLHLTGGEPFMNFERLCKAVAMAAERGIPSLFVETNASWCSSDDVTRDKLRSLKAAGLHGILVSVNPFFLEFVAFERTERAIRISCEVFGANVMIYQVEYFRRFVSWGLEGTLSFADYLKRERRRDLLSNVEFFVMGRAPYALRDVFEGLLRRREAAAFFRHPCQPSFLRTWHNHVDNYANYMPGFCGGISLGDARELDRLTTDGIALDDYPVLAFLIDEDMRGLFDFARARGYQERADGYFSKCHVCADVRRYLAGVDQFRELQPAHFYRELRG